MHPIPLARFNALAGYCRLGPAMGLVEEVSWFESEDGRLLGLVLRDNQDGDYQGAFFARDHAERFRWIGGTEFSESLEGAAASLQAQAPALHAQLDRVRGQGDEVHAPVDFFALQVAEDRLHPSFDVLRRGEGYSPARALITAMMRWYEDIDGNYIEQFQTTAFDARLLELYVFALLVENGFAIQHVGAAPDYLAEDGSGQIAIEVTTANPTMDAQGRPVPVPQIDTPEQQQLYVKQYVPIRFGSALTSKLRRRYWQLPHVAGRPLLFAIQDFHAPGSMTFARTGLGIYLHGYDYPWYHDPDGRLVIVPRQVTEHRWGDKVIESGFFRLAGAEHVSAVLFNSGATLAKFNRMGFIAGLSSRRVRMTRVGYAISLDPNASAPLRFVQEVDENHHESWSEGLDVFHNPRALHPLRPESFPTANHHYLQADGQMRTESIDDGFRPLSSVTQILVPDDEAPIG